MFKRLFVSFWLLLLAWSPALAETKVYEFYADWCQPCQQMTPVVEAVVAKGFAIQRINVDANQQFAQQLQVSSIPALVIVRDGKVVARELGVMSEQRLIGLIAKFRETMLRYSTPAGTQLATVRIICRENGGVAMGSGVVTTWKDCPVVLTARHVVSGNKQAVVRFLDGSEGSGEVIATDRVWDCAAILVSVPSAISPAPLAYGPDGNVRKGVRYTACGFGPDEKFAVNDGEFLGFFKPGDANVQSTDWAAISGRVRQGDSGGPVFDDKGRVAGILWGTNGERVVFTQIGQIQVFLQTAMQGRCGPGGCGPIMGRAPQTRQGRDVSDSGPPAPTSPQPSSEQMNQAAAEAARQYMIPFRNEISQRQNAIEGRLEVMQGQMQGIENSLQAIANGQQSQAPPVPPTAPPVAEEKPDSGPKTVIGRITEKEGEFISEHGGPISSRLADRGLDKLESDDPKVRFVGFTQVTIAKLIFGGVVLVIGFLLVRVIHRINEKVLPKLQERAAATSNTMDDRVVNLLQKVHDKVDGVDARVKEHLPWLQRLESGADAMAHAGKAAVYAISPAMLAAMNPGAAPVAVALTAAPAAVQAAQAVSSLKDAVFVPAATPPKA